MKVISILRSLRKIYQFFIDRPFKIGEAINDCYEVRRIISSGSYGIVYLCKDSRTDDNLVIKQLRPSKRRSKSEIKLFKNEISILRKLDHEYMPMLYEAFLIEGNYFYAMTFIDGDDLDEQLFSNKKTFDEGESLFFLAQLLALVAYLHERDIYHQDLRIPNILLKNNYPYLIDFGLAMQADSNNPSNKNKELILEMKQQDYFDLGDILLFLFYSTYEAKNKKALPWTEELSLTEESIRLLKRLLKIEKPYMSIKEISADLHAAIKAVNQE
ncbi:protein kinase domain-containing protein [Oceanobacillus zhaokaii]|uniref:protein kinase domain-containing protein n=1 Tax=Oceanobacillus zhaokaii TaxID=2052660 RepID=UPI001FA8A85B|nr:protein kinase [Oceanobacillus zhaokaii]